MPIIEMAMWHLSQNIKYAVGELDIEESSAYIFKATIELLPKYFILLDLPNYILNSAQTTLSYLLSLVILGMPSLPTRGSLHANNGTRPDPSPFLMPPVCKATTHPLPNLFIHCNTFSFLLIALFIFSNLPALNESKSTS